MKKLLVLILISASAFGQSVEITPATSGSQSNAIIKKNGVGFEQTNGTIRVGTFVSNAYGALIQTHSNHPLGFTTNDGYRQFVINTDGKVGVGFDIPNYWLDVVGRARIKHYTDTNPVINETAGIWYNKSNNTEGAFAGMFNDDIYGLFGMGTASNWKFGFDLVNTKMGIGTMNPKHPLTFPDAIGDKISFWGGNTAAIDNHYGIGIQGGALQFYTPTASENIVFGTGRSGAFTENMRIKGNGRVGIGTNAPAYKLHVNNVGEGIGIVHTNDAGIKIGTFINSIAGWFGTFSNHPMVLCVNNSFALGITADRRFQFGTTDIPAGYKMSVDGNIICTDVVVLPTSSWPDYVFKSDYRLKPLHEVETFIQANGHLPNIPKASDIDNKALALGNMSKLQMEKIEELTLYMIEMNKNLIETNKRLKKVEDENIELKKQLRTNKSQK
jgi:hypothetical protein